MGDSSDDTSTTTSSTTTTKRPDEADEDKMNIFLPIYILTAVFGFIFIFGPLMAPKGPNRGVVRCMIMLSSFSMWIFWVTVYIGQMNPLMGPRIPNTTLAWVAHTWGKSAT